MPWLQPSSVLALVVAGVLWIDVAGRLIVASPRAALLVRGAAVVKVLAAFLPTLANFGFSVLAQLGIPYDLFGVLPPLCEAAFWVLLAVALVRLVGDAPARKELR